MKYLFVCKSNVGRSQMAAALFNGIVKDVALTAGTHVNEKAGQTLHPYVLQVMLEIGYDLSNNKRVQLSPELVQSSDKIIVMLDNRSDLPKFVPLEKVEFWDVPDARGTSLEFHRKIRVAIKEKIKKLLLRKNNITSNEVG